MIGRIRTYFAVAPLLAALGQRVSPLFVLWDLARAVYLAGRTYGALVLGFRRVSATWREALLLPAVALAAFGGFILPPIAVANTWINDLKNNVVSAIALAILARTASANGSGVDMIAGFGNCFGLQFVGAVTGTTPTLDTKYQESDTSGGTYTDCLGDVHAQVTAADKFSIANFRRSKRFVRAASTIAGTTPSFTYGVAVLQMKKAI